MLTDGAVRCVGVGVPVERERECPPRANWRSCCSNTAAGHQQMQGWAGLGRWGWLRQSGGRYSHGIHGGAKKFPKESLQLQRTAWEGGFFTRGVKGGFLKQKFLLGLYGHPESSRGNPVTGKRVVGHGWMCVCWGKENIFRIEFLNMVSISKDNS